MSQIEMSLTGEPDERTAAIAAPEAREILISVNRRAGARWRSDRVEQIRRELAALGYDAWVSSDLAELSARASAASSHEKIRAVVAVGGDGTASIVRRHVPLEIPMLPVPMGTENLLGRYLGQSSDAHAVCRTLAQGITVGLDLGVANEQPFLLMISAGFDAEVVRALHERRQGNITRLDYLVPALRTMRRYRYPQMRVEALGTAPGDEEMLSCRWFFGFNLPLYAIGLPIAPDAVATDGKLDVCLFERGSTLGVLRYLWHVRLGGHHLLDDAKMLRYQRFRLDAPGGHSVAYQLDGDYGGTLPVDVEVRARQLRLMVPREAARRLGFSLPEDG